MHLSPREAEIEAMLLEGHTVKDIAGMLGISPRTAEAHRSTLYRKRGVHSKMGLVRAAINRGEEWKLNGGRIATMLGLA